MKLREKHWRAMERVRDGAEIYSDELAELLRDVEEWRPNYILIANTWEPPKPGMPRNPWFKAILTPAGIAALDRHRERVWEVVA
jgi:hypothetical protein